MQAQARAQTTGVALNHFRAVVAAAAALGTFLFFVVFGVLFFVFQGTLSYHLPFVLEWELLIEVFTGREVQVPLGIRERARRRDMFMEIQ